MTLPRPFIFSLLLSAGALLAACDQLPGRGVGEPPAARPALPEDAAPPAPMDGSETQDEASADSDPEPAEIAVRPASASTSTNIDWDAARRDLASRPIESREGTFQVASGDAAPPVPVFLPSGPVAAASANGGGVRFQPTRDGYFAFFPGEAWDAVVNGTNRVIGAPGETAQPRSDSFNFQPTLTGAQVAFSRYGADYLVEFECKELTNGLPTCITHEEAIAFAEDLVISGTR